MRTSRMLACHTYIMDHPLWDTKVCPHKFGLFYISPLCMAANCASDIENDRIDLDLDLEDHAMPVHITKI